VSRLYELGESEEEIEVSQLNPYGAVYEEFCTDASFDWVIYSSHESSITVAGEQLLPAFQEAWPEWRRHLYDVAGGPHGYDRQCDHHSSRKTWWRRIHSPVR
jgi:hypothetical protein